MFNIGDKVTPKDGISLVAGGQVGKITAAKSDNPAFKGWVVVKFPLISIPLGFKEEELDLVKEKQ